MSDAISDKLQFLIHTVPDSGILRFALYGKRHISVGRGDWL